ncbi:MAG: hypothetical protein KG028_08720 [Actinobacteria bacterium]|jgi:hypothetical protein|nr:hypothetical protein [Actinomycetota bacterium]
MVRLLAHHGPEALLPLLAGMGAMTFHYGRLRLATRRSLTRPIAGAAEDPLSAPVSQESVAVVTMSRRSSP